jgi:hypothetical protein
MERPLDGGVAKAWQAKLLRPQASTMKSLSCFSRVSSRLNGAPHEYWA